MEEKYNKEPNDPYDWVWEQDKRFPISLEKGLPLTSTHYGGEALEKINRTQLED
jgi:hypothetical protein